MIFILIAILVVLLIWGISTYNFFVSTKTRIGAAIQEIGNQLKRQFELIPNLEASVKGYLKHEKSIFDELTEVRKIISKAIDSKDAKTMAEAGKAISDVLPKIQVVVENNPEIKASDVVSDLMNELRDTSDKVMYARRLLIDLTADYNVKIVSFPSNIIAGMFGFKKEKGLETPETGDSFKTTESEMKTPKVDLG